ncbi:hypothetical protein EV44_g0264 [Erysiphe necator]|uniref:Secreted protein n=1 Tax=Uncinula necator TaxID=52586 RepID=A0A0B1PGG0_UNCNE|nr:hypothetical protein EV44_g0264 [Erysiphe necator]
MLKLFHTGIAGLSATCTALSIRPQWWVVGGVTIPCLVGRFRSGHHTSDPKVATETTHASIAITRGFGTAPLKTGFNLRKCWAIFNALLHYVST